MAGGGTLSEHVDALLGFAAYAETLGYARFWLTQHYSEREAWGDPFPLLTLLGAATSRIRIGTGGLLLRNSVSIQVGSAFRFLMELYSNRVDIGVTRGIASHDDFRANAQRELYDIAFEDRMRTLVALIAPGSSLPPPSLHEPQFWLMGANGASRELARRLRINYAHSRFLASAATPAVRSSTAERYCMAYFASPNETVTTDIASAKVSDSVFLRGSARDVARAIDADAACYGATDAMVALIGGSLEQRRAWISDFAIAARLSDSAAAVKPAPS